MLDVLFCLLLLAPFVMCAQAPPNLPPGSLGQLMVQQPLVDVASPVGATAAFDPPVVRPGEKTFYRVTVDATESSIQWPEKFPAPSALELAPVTSGQIVQMLGNSFRPMTAFLYPVRAGTSGQFTIPAFVVEAYGKPVTVPAANLDVVADNAVTNPPLRQLLLETSATNLFVGQPFRVRVLLPAAPPNSVEALREVQLNGDGFITDKSTLRQAIEMVDRAGGKMPAFVYEVGATPIATGPLALSAQGFTAGREFTGPISITGQVVLSGGLAHYVLLVADPVQINVRPLPDAGRLPGFTGGIGKFFLDPPRLATNRLRVGVPVQIKVAVHGDGDVNRLVPPASPRVKDWQIIPDNPPGISFTLIPLTDEVTDTPAIPFSSFDPATASYVDLTIPSLPVTVAADSLPVKMPALDDETKSETPLALSDLSPTPGKTAASLKPLQLRGGFVCVQMVPVVGFLALWQWDRRRRFLEAHPEIVRRRQARRALRREIKKLEKAASAGDTAAFVRHAADALKISVAPNYPAHPQALVCADVLAQLDEAERSGSAGETVRKIFAAADTRFALTPQAQAELPKIQSDVFVVLQKLEEKL